MQNKYRIKKNSEFRRVYKFGTSIANRELVLYLNRNVGVSQFRLGISVSKKIGNAVVRNRIKRLIKEAFRTISNEYVIKEYSDIVIIARKPAIDMEYKDFIRSLKHLLNKLKLLLNK